MAGMPWSQRQKMEAAGQALVGWETTAQAAGMHIAQMNIRIEPTQAGDPFTDLVFEWSDEADEYTVRTAGT